ncbi:hypothetical protein ACM26V_18735 [Salipaludibacillus sp. HK11]|uniref:hypothetical protein n=1 Tax=Salipaludibacillus sp. HK11 TaxID=3394320 RepID=UPI0039FC00B1
MIQFHKQYKWTISIFIVIMLGTLLSFTHASYASDDDDGFIMPDEEPFRLVDTDATSGTSGNGSGGGNWGPDAPGGFIPGGIPEQGSNPGGPGTNNPDPNHSDPNGDDKDRGFWGDLGESLRDGFETAWDGIRNGGEITWDFMKEQGKRGMENAGELWDDTVAKTSSLWESSLDWLNSAGEWIADKWDSLGDLGQDLVKTIVSVLGVAAIAVGIVLIGLVTWPVALVAIGGAALFAGIYFAINGGSDSFNWGHSFLWAAGGGLLGGVAQSMGGIVAGAKALGKAFIWARGGLQMMWLRNVHLGMKQLGALGFAKTVAGGAAKLFFGGIAASLIIDGINFYVLGIEKPVSQVITDSLFTGVASALTFGLAKGYIFTSLGGKLGWAAYSGGVFGTMELFRGYFNTGSFEMSNFLIGAAVGAVFGPLFSVAKKIGNIKMSMGNRNNSEMFGLNFTIDFISSHTDSFFKSKLKGEELKVGEHLEIEKQMEKKYYSK